MNVNMVIIAGNLTKDPELRSTAGGTSVGNFTLAVNRVWSKDGEKKEEVSFIKVIVWGKLAELCGQYLAKGSGALIEGRLKQESWETKEGQKRDRTCVVAERIQFIGNKNKNTSAPAEDTVPDDTEIPF